MSEVNSHDDIKGIGYEEKATEEDFVITTRNLIPSACNGENLTKEDKEKHAEKFLKKREEYLKRKKNVKK